MLQFRSANTKEPNAFIQRIVNCRQALTDAACDAAIVAIKLLEFWTSRVIGWFAQAEAKFATKGVFASLPRYFYVIQVLNQRTINFKSASRPSDDLLYILDTLLHRLFLVDTGSPFATPRQSGTLRRAGGLPCHGGFGSGLAFSCQEEAPC